jgi:hypothetical protein
VLSLPCVVTVNVSNLHPLAVPLTQNGSMVRVDGNQEMLFRPVIHLFGNKNRTLDGKILKASQFQQAVMALPSGCHEGFGA